MALTLACAPGTEAPPPSSTASGIVPLNLEASVEYVGMEQCRDCHLGVYTTHTQTGMGRAFFPMSADVVVEDFHDKNMFVAEGSGLRYRMFERDGKYFQRQFVLDSKGAEIAGVEREMVWVVGSNHHSRSYLTVVDGKTFQAPACWYPGATKWDLCPGFENKNEHFGREVSPACLFCHNGKMQLVEGERNEFKTPFPQGIGCERCHGPGQLHVERWRTNEQPTGEPDLTIVNPRRLPQRERMDVCFQCHFGDARATARVSRFDRELDDYRPGAPLTDVAVMFAYEEQTQIEFGLSSQADRMVLSKCFTESGGKIECLTCHDPHVTVYHESRPSDYFRKKCLSCHAAEDCDESVETRSQTTPQDDCIACHMRKAEPDDQKYTEFTDHWIRKQIDVNVSDHRTDYSIRAAFASDLESISRGEQHYLRGRAAFLMAQDAPAVHWPEMWGDAVREFKAALDAGFENEDVWFFLGKTYTFQGRRDEAMDCYRKALEHDPDHHDGLFALGTAYLEINNPQSASESFGRILVNDPDDAMALAEYGRSVFALGRSEEALDYFQRAVAREPWEPTLQLNLGMSLAAVGRLQEAAEAGQRAVSLDPERLESWSLFHNAMREAGNTDRAREGKWYADRLAQILAASPRKQASPSM